MLQGVWPQVPGETWAGCRYHGDTVAAASRIGLVTQLLQRLKTLNTGNLPVFQVEQDFEDGTRITVRRRGRVYGADVFVAPVVPREPLPRLAARRFYHVPGCRARYDGTDVANAIPHGRLAGATLGYGTAVTRLDPREAGLLRPTGLPEAAVRRRLGVFALPGGPASGLLFTRTHIPDAAAFSVSVLVRLRQTLEYDYTYDDREVPNPFRTYLVQGRTDGAFSWDCPGSIAPVIGFCSPHRHPEWIETVTYPWAPWKSDYTSHTEHLLGARRAQTVCSGAPRLEGEACRDAAGHDYPYPCGFIMGIQAAGLFLYNGNRLLGVRLSHFETQTGYAPALTGPLETGLWYHAVMTHAADGAVRVFLAASGRKASVASGSQPLCAMDANCSFQASGVNAWTLSNGLTGTVIGAYRMNPVMDVALPRFYDRALAAAEVSLLQFEGLHGLFVADDHEAARAIGLGFTPVVV